MLTNNVFCVFLPDKTLHIVEGSYLKEVYLRFDANYKILSDKGSELKNKLFLEIATP